MTIKNEKDLTAAFAELDYDDKRSIEEINLVMKVLEETRKQWENLTDEQLEKIVRGDV